MNTKSTTAQRLAGLPARWILRVVFVIMLSLTLCRPTQSPRTAQAAPTGATYYVDWVNGSDFEPRNFQDSNMENNTESGRHDAGWRYNHRVDCLSR